MGIFLWDTAPSKIFIGSSEVASVWAWNTKIRPPYPKESIVYKMKADSSGKLYVPIAWQYTWSGFSPYNRKVSVDGWTTTTYSWTWSSWWSITISWFTAWTSHTIMIVPTSENYLWARAYGWQNTAWRTYLTEILYDESYIWYAVSATDAWMHFRRSQYQWCTSLINAANEYMPDTVTTIAAYFRVNQYRWCTSLLKAADEEMSSGISANFWQSFRSGQYRDCTSLIYAWKEKLPSGVANVWTYFRSVQYYWCTSLTFASEEELPSTVTWMGTYFRESQYSWCTSLTEIKWWKDLNVWNNYYRYQQFYNCTANKTVKVIWDKWRASYWWDTLSNDYVTTVYVPSAYLSTFISATWAPWGRIDDSKFVWY